MRLKVGPSYDVSILLFGNEAMMLSILIVVIVSGDFYIITVKVEILYY